jgi:hypothetical protein
VHGRVSKLIAAQQSGLVLLWLEVAFLFIGKSVLSQTKYYS